MSSMLERLESLPLLIADPGLNRRRFISRAMRFSAAVAATAAGVGATTQVEAANVHCCNLAFPNNICRQPCPCSTTFWAWDCTDSRDCRTWSCGECWNCGCSVLTKICNCC